MREIQLTQSQIALVDDEDFTWLIQWKWYAIWNGKFYAARWRADGREGHLLMHRQILNAPTGQECDHRNGDGLDNQRCNLRLCSTAQNQHNSRIHVDNTSGIKGVDFLKANGMWRVRIAVKNDRKFVGYFSSKEDAARARSEAARRYHGEFANYCDSTIL